MNPHEFCICFWKFDVFGTLIQGLLFYLAAEISAYCSSQDVAHCSGNVKFIVVIEMEYINHFNV